MIPYKLSGYSTIVFDCDGVLLDSNRIKTEAFRTVASQFGDSVAEDLVRFHVSHGGISRYRKFEYLLSTIIGIPADESEIKRLSTEYGEIVFSELLQCPCASNLKRLREETAHANWMVVSGGAQSELREIFSLRGLAPMFNGGIYGSPDTKDKILYERIDCGDLKLPAIFFGDSRYDHEAAQKAGLQFVFVHGWTELDSWGKYCIDNGLFSIERVDNLLTLEV